MAAEETDDRGLVNEPELFSYVEPLCLPVGTCDGYEVVFQLDPAFLLSVESSWGRVRLVLVYGDRLVGDLKDACVDADGCIRLAIHGVQELPPGVVDVLLLSSTPSSNESHTPGRAQVIASASLPLLPAEAAEEMCLLFEDMMMAADSSAPAIMQQESALPGASILDTTESGLIDTAANYQRALQHSTDHDTKHSQHTLPRVPWLVDPARAAVWAHHYQPLLADLRLALGPGVLCSGEQQLPIGSANAAQPDSGQRMGGPMAESSKDAIFLLLCRSEVMERLTEYFKQNCMPCCSALLQASTEAGWAGSPAQRSDVPSAALPASPAACKPGSGVLGGKAGQLDCQVAACTLAEQQKAGSTALALLPGRVTQALLGFQDATEEAKFSMFQRTRSVGFDSVSALILAVAVCSCFRSGMKTCTPAAACNMAPLYWSWELLSHLLLAAFPVAFTRHWRLPYLAATITSAALVLLGALRLPTEAARDQLGRWLNVMCFGMLYPLMKQICFYRLAWVMTLLVACKWWLLGVNLPNVPAARLLLLAVYAASLLLALLVDMQGRAAYLESAAVGSVQQQGCK